MFDGVNSSLIFAVIASTFGSAFQHGYNTGVLNNPQIIIVAWLKQSMIDNGYHSPGDTELAFIWSIVTSIYCFGGMLGGLCTGLVADLIGRKWSLISNNILVLGSAAMIILAKRLGRFELLIMARFLLGINSGLNAGLTPMYLNEISPIGLRGAIGSCYQLIITMSILAAQCLGYEALLGSEDWWDILLAFIAIPSVFQIVTMPFCPESPRYLLLTKDNPEKAEKALKWLRKSDEVKDELRDMVSEADAQKALPKVTYLNLVTNRSLRIPLIISLMVMVAQQTSGINAVIFYSTDILKNAGLKQHGATIATMVNGMVNVLMTIISLILVEMTGRKTLLIIGFSGTLTFMCLLNVSIIFTRYSALLSSMCIFFVTMFIVSFAVGPGTVPWFLTSELFNQSARPKAISLAVFTNWLANTIITLSFLPIKEAIGPFVFTIFIAFTICSLIFIIFAVPETKNKSIEEISAQFES